MNKKQVVFYLLFSSMCIFAVYLVKNKMDDAKKQITGKQVQVVCRSQNSSPQALSVNASKSQCVQAEEPVIAASIDLSTTTTQATGSVDQLENNDSQSLVEESSVDGTKDEEVLVSIETKGPLSTASSLPDKESLTSEVAAIEGDNGSDSMNQMPVEQEARKIIWDPKGTSDHWRREFETEKVACWTHPKPKAVTQKKGLGTTFQLTTIMKYSHW